MINVAELTTQWLNLIHSDKEIPNARNVFHQCHLESVALKRTGSDVIENPALADPVGTYRLWAKEAETPGTQPISLYDGMQTIVNLARVKAQFDPLDMSPNGKGDMVHFNAFTNNVSACPAITLESSQTTWIEQKSHDANVLVKSFVDGFIGVLEKDRTSIYNSVSQLVQAALSYSQKTQKMSNFTQNLLQVEPNKQKVYFNLYCSVFEISTTEDKGTITYYSKYQLAQAIYSMTQTMWDIVKGRFAEQQKTTVDDWIDSMKTPVKPGSTIKALCLVDK